MAKTFSTPRRCRRCGAVTVADYAKTCVGCGESLRFAEKVDVIASHARAAPAPRPAPAPAPVPERPSSPAEPPPRTAREALERILEAKRRADEEAEREEAYEEAEEEAVGAPGGRRKRGMGLMTLFYILFIVIALLNSLLKDKDVRRWVEEFTGAGESVEGEGDAVEEGEDASASDRMAVIKARAALEAIAKSVEIFAYRNGRIPRDREEWIASPEYRTVAPRLLGQFEDGADPDYEPRGRTIEGERYRVTAVARDKARTEITVFGVARTPPGP